MKKLLCVTIALLYATAMQAQDEKAGVTKFLGIPIDGYKPAMIEKLKAKGFIPSIAGKDVLEGEFNGVDVHVHIATNNNKVWRIMLADQNTCGETDIKIRFNRLCRQFENNPKYIPRTKPNKEQTIPDDEHLSYEMAVNNKGYAAFYSQVPDSVTKEQALGYLTGPIEDMTGPIGELSPEKVVEHYSNLQKCAMAFENKTVGFMIHEESAEKYRICMFYENRYNDANGEDL
ncbi:hypothetical protein [Alistipes sp.]|uniref:hypothetical protein n=1 Tax=Alistipes sp. TaxID=1872444 RepID=UPI00307F7EE8